MSASETFSEKLFGPINFSALRDTKAWGQLEVRVQGDRPSVWLWNCLGKQRGWHGLTCGEARALAADLILAADKAETLSSPAKGQG